MRLVLTAFEPFGGKTSNRSLQILSRLRISTQLRQLEAVRFVEVPVVRGAPLTAMTGIFDGTVWDYVLCIGEGNKESLALEHTAVNERDYRMPDNAGNVSQHEAIVENGPPAYQATFPYGCIEHAARTQDIATHGSDNAGRFLCNELLYAALHCTHTTNSSTQVGFVHVPATVDESGTGRDDELTETLAAVFEKGLIQIMSHK